MTCRRCGHELEYSDKYGYDCSNVECEHHCRTQMEEEARLVHEQQMDAFSDVMGVYPDHLGY